MKEELSARALIADMDVRGPSEEGLGDLDGKGEPKPRFFQIRSYPR